MGNTRKISRKRTKEHNKSISLAVKGNMNALKTGAYSKRRYFTCSETCPVKVSDKGCEHYKEGEVCYFQANAPKLDGLRNKNQVEELLVDEINNMIQRLEFAKVTEATEQEAGLKGNVSSLQQQKIGLLKFLWSLKDDV